MINPKKQRQSLPWMPARQRGTETNRPIWWLTFHPGTSAFFWPCRWIFYRPCHCLHLVLELWPMLLIWSTAEDETRHSDQSYIPLPVQHYLTAFGAIIAVPLLLAEGLCLQHDSLVQSQLINTIFLVSGLCTVLQVTLGVRSECLEPQTIRRKQNVQDFISARYN